MSIRLWQTRISAKGKALLESGGHFLDLIPEDRAAIAGMLLTKASHCPFPESRLMRSIVTQAVEDLGVAVSWEEKHGRRRPTNAENQRVYYVLVGGWPDEYFKRGHHATPSWYAGIDPEYVIETLQMMGLLGRDERQMAA